MKNNVFESEVEIPKGLIAAFYEGYSNFDHAMPEDFEAKVIRNRETHYYPHSAWNFYGKIWFDGKNFIETVMRYGSDVATYVSDDLGDLIYYVNQKHGSD